VLDSKVSGRRSALDVIRYPGIEAQLAGEFIAGFLDQPRLDWGHEPYGVVTMFDVLEHLYEPRNAFRNLAEVVRHNGLVFVETGDADSFWPRHFGVHRWWYVRLLEHHVFWTRQSLEAIAMAHGFKIVQWKMVRHKSRRKLVPLRTLGDLLKVALYWVAAERYSAIAEMFGKHGNQPWYPFAHDHIRACLRRT
jgi:SAM-dependent methyltransferase